MDQEVALQVDTPKLPSAPLLDVASPLAAAQKLSANDTALQAGQTQLQMFNRQNAGEDIQLRSQLIRDAASHALDSDSWDAAMRNAAAKGAPEAQQYIGRYTPLLQQRLFQAYAGGGDAAAGGAGGASSAVAGSPTTPSDVLDRMYQNATPQQIATVLQRSNAMLSALSTVKDQPTYDRAIQSLVDAGMPQAASLRGPYNPLAVINLYNKTLQHANYLQGRMASNTAGEPNPLVKNDVQTIGGVGYSVDPYSGTAKPITPAEPKKIGMDEFGKDIYGIPDSTAPGGYRRVDASTLPGTGGGLSFADAASRIQGGENSTGNPAAKNPNSTATGNGQFIDSTWLSTFKSEHPDLAKTMNDQQILGLRSVPAFANEMTEAYAKQNADALSKDGIPITTATLALAHRFGPDGAIKIHDAMQNAPMESLVSQKVLDANPELKGKTAGQVVQGIVSKVGNDPVGAGQGAVPASSVGPDTHGDDYLKSLPADKAALVRQIAEGRSPYPSGFMLKTPYGQWLVSAISQYDPGFTAQTYQQRQKAYNYWYAGGDGDKTYKRLDQAMEHAADLAPDVDTLKNGSFPLLNKAENAASSAIGNPSSGPLATNAHALADELAGIWKGGNLSDAEIRAWGDAFPVDGSVAQQKASVKKLIGLVEGGMTALQDQRERDLGPAAKTLPDPITDRTAGIINSLKNWANGRGQYSAPTTPVDPRDAAALKANSHNPAAAAAIDKKYGAGAAARILGQ